MVLGFFLAAPLVLNLVSRKWLLRLFVERKVRFDSSVVREQASRRRMAASHEHRQIV